MEGKVTKLAASLLIPAHRRLVTLLAEVAVENYLAETEPGRTETYTQPQAQRASSARK